MPNVEFDGLKTVQRLKVTCYDTDVAHYLKPGAFMDLAQEIAYISADRLHFGYADLQRHGLAWVLSRMHICFPSMPRWNDVVTLETWHKGFSGPFYVRDFRMTGADGRPAVRATSSWLIIDVASRRLLRREHLAEYLPVDTECHESAVDEPCDKVMMPREGVEQVASHRVAYSDVDIIGHTNNAKYVVWAMDCLPFEELAAHRVREIRINFNKETRPGDTVDLFRAPVEGGWAVEGRLDGASSFICLFSFL